MSREKPLILLVDDVPKNLSLLGNMLRTENYDIAVATSGQQAIKIAKATTPDLILLDIMMPEMDGYEVCRRLKNDKETADSRIIFLTARNEAEDIVKGFKIGAVDYITKPFSGTELIIRVKTHLELKQNKDELLVVYNELKIKNDKLENAYDKLKEISQTDMLTKLSNRRAMIEKLNHEVSRFNRTKKPFSVIISDIDDFKRINDNFGHECGDAVLVSISSVLKKNMRNIDAVARWGGEEFLMMLPDTKSAGAKIVAEKLRASIEADRVEYDGQKHQITMTFGIAEFNDKDYDINYYIRQADEALYKGKEQGKNQVMVSENDR